MKFRYLLSRLADDYPEGIPGHAPQVAGIYLAWRGLTFTKEPLKHVVSYWPERQKAKKMGRVGIPEAVCEIESTLAPYRSQSEAFLILAGHSFGARVLENAINEQDASGRCPTMHDYFQQLHRLANNARNSHAVASIEGIRRLPNLPADMIIYVNAATSSEKTRERIAQIKLDCPSASSALICNSDPLFLAFTSTNDLATGFIMPVANFVFPDLASDKFHLISAADSPWMHTHQTPKKAPSKTCPAGESICFKIAHENSEPVEYYLPRIAGKAQVPPDKAHPAGIDPFWIFNVKSNLVDGHGDVWNPNVVNMLTVILQNNGHFQAVHEAAAKVAP